MRTFLPPHRRPFAFAAAALLTLGAFAVAAYPATVRCATASEPAEFAICNSEILQTLDASIDGAWRREFAAAGVLRSQELSRGQSDWQRELAGCRSDMACLERRMRDRLDDFAEKPKAEAKQDTKVAAKAEVKVEAKFETKAPPKVKPVAEFKRFAEGEAGGN